MQKELFKSIREKNRILNQWEQYYRKEKLQSFPRIIQLPTGTRCNIRCRFCTDRKNGTSGTYDNLSYEECLSIIKKGKWEQALRLVESIDLYGWGEPLFNPDYEKIFDYLMDNFPGLGINISTNGILFKKNWAEKFISIDNSIINFSVNAATKETFSALTGSDQFDRVVNNISYLTDLREKYRTKKPLVSLSYVATTENINELPQFIRLAAELKVDCVKVQDVIIISEETKQLSLTNTPEAAKEFCKLAESEAAECKIKVYFYVNHNVDYFQNDNDSETKKDYSTHTPHNTSESKEVPSPYLSSTDCFEPWEMFQVGANGEVWPCCRFLNVPGMTLGNIKKKSFDEIWNGAEYTSLRSTINTDNPPPVCAICPRKSGLDF